MTVAVFDQLSTRLDRLLSNRRLVVLVGVVLLGAGLYLQLTSIINHDTAWYLYATGKFLDGAKLYVDIVEVNPPLAFYLTVPGVLLSRVTGLFIVDAFVIYVFVLIAISLLLAQALLRIDAKLPTSARTTILLSALVGLAIYPTGSFGQREHLMLILALPYLLLASLRARRIGVNPGLAVVVGGIAALGLALKPHFLIVPVMIEIYLIATTRRFSRTLRPETASFGFMVLVYLIAIILVTPEYFTTIVPYAFAVYNDAYRNPLAEVIERRETVLLPMVLLLLLATRRRLFNSEYIDIVGLAAAALYAIYLIQMKGWPYQLYPSSALFIIALFVFLPAVAAAVTKPGQSVRTRWMGFGVAGIAVATAIWMIGGAVWRGSDRSAYLVRMLPVVRHHAENSSIYVFTTNVSTAFPLVTYSGVGWSSRFPTLWLLPGLVLRQHVETGASTTSESTKLNDIHRYVIDSVMEDLARTRPALIVIDERADKPYFNGTPFDFLEYFGRDPRFNDIWSPYEKIAEWEGFGVYVDRRPR